jgi:hypothetical protein
MRIKQDLEELFQKEQYYLINNYSKQLLIESVGQEALDLINKEISNTREDTKVYSKYQEIAESIKKDFNLNSPSILCFHEELNFPKELTNDFIKETKIILIKSLKQKAEYQQIILIPNTMDEYAALMRAAGILRRNFELSDSDVEPTKKLKI